MPFLEEIFVLCDETSKPLANSVGYPLKFESHSEALKAAEAQGWYVTDHECLSPEGYDRRYRPEETP